MDVILDLLARVYDEHGYIDDQGNHRHRIPTTFTDSERQCLIDAGLQPNTFIAIAHDDAIARLRAKAAAVDLRRAADAFVGSMTSSDLGWQTVLPAAALGLAMPAHAAAPMGGGRCRICFHSGKAVDSTMQAYFRRLQGSPWGNDDPVTGVLALEHATSGSDWPQPSARDIWVLHRLLDLLRALPRTARYGKARTAFNDAKLLRVNHRDRGETVLEALAFIGILETPEHPGMLTRFTDAVERDRRPDTRVEVPAPLAWWTAGDGLNEALVTRLFGHLERPVEEPPSTHSARSVRSKSRPPARPKAIPGPVAAGDVYVIRYREDLWGAVYCHEARTDERGVCRGRIEFLDILGPTPATAGQIADIGYRDRHDGRWQCWCSGLDKTTGVRRIAAAIPAPPHKQPIPERIPFAATSELRHLARWNFSGL